jgi:DNA-binding CsgD family transcriptional regulator
MKNNVIARDDLGFVQAVNRIMFCNPLLPERTELEKEALGRDYSVSPRPWNVYLAHPAKDANLAALVARAAETAERCRANLARQPPASAAEAELYFNFIWFCTYYRYREDLDRFIRESHALGNSKRVVDFYEDSRRDAESYLSAGGHVVRSPHSHEWMFAYGFQIRRAFHHIFQFILGTSPSAMGLRARVWQSIFTHDAQRYLRSLVHRMGDIITLITGPSGSGKELVARAIALSRFIPLDPQTGRFEQDFLDAFHPLNLAALSPTLIESELFGHRKGAFTGALADYPGHFETCGPHGTVFLDEIGDVAMPVQVKLLRVLETRKFNRLGDTRLLPFEGKIVAATNRAPAQLIQRGELREDFYYRLCADRIATVSLSDILAGSPEETRYLVRHIATKVVGEEEAESLTQEVCAWIDKTLGSKYSWPGNVRELEQCIRNIMVHGEYYPEQTPPELTFAEQLDSGGWTADELLRRYTERVYARTRNYEETARILDLDSRTVKKHLRPAR